MTVLTSEDRGDLLRWIFSGALVLAAHGGLAAAMAQWSDPLEPAESASAIVIELAPLPVAPNFGQRGTAIPATAMAAMVSFQPTPTLSARASLNLKSSSTSTRAHNLQPRLKNSDRLSTLRAWAACQCHLR